VVAQQLAKLRLVQVVVLGAQERGNLHGRQPRYRWLIVDEQPTGTATAVARPFLKGSHTAALRKLRRKSKAA
jgi:hypothetical protein